MSESVPGERLEALAQKCLRGLDVPSWVADEIRALLAESREEGEPLRDGYLEAVSAPVWPPTPHEKAHDEAKKRYPDAALAAPPGETPDLEAERDMHWKKRAYDTLAQFGVPFERARSIANGIRVLAARYEKETASLRTSPPQKPPLSDHDFAGSDGGPLPQKPKGNLIDCPLCSGTGEHGGPVGSKCPKCHGKAQITSSDRHMCKGCGKEMGPAYEAVWSGGTARHWDVKAQAWCGPVKRTV